MKSVHLSSFGKHHWALLHYIEICQNRHGGYLDPNQMRRTTSRHLHPTWDLINKKNHGTELHGFDQSMFQDLSQAEKDGFFISDHDDWDCLDDLVQNDLVIMIKKETHHCELSVFGAEVARQIQSHIRCKIPISKFSPEIKKNKPNVF